jgi:ribonuclease VapC
VIDTSALLALLFREPGEDVVRARGREGLLSAVSYSETIAKAVDGGTPLALVHEAIDRLQLTIVPFDEEHGRRAASFRPATRRLEFSFADRACLATASLAGLPALAADRDWAKVDLGVEVLLIRNAQ